MVQDTGLVLCEKGANPWWLKMIIYEKQTKIWKEEFFECWKLQELYGDEIPIDLWTKLFNKAK